MLLYRHGLLHIPDEPPRLEILQVCHDSRMAGHLGIAKTTELISRNYWWSSLWKLVQAFVNSCDTCSWAKAPGHQPHGLFHPLLVTEGPLESISIDLIPKLPRSNNYDSIFMVVNNF